MNGCSEMTRSGKPRSSDRLVIGRQELDFTEFQTCHMSIRDCVFPFGIISRLGAENPAEESKNPGRYS
jgi:hypothetical protein